MQKYSIGTSIFKIILPKNLVEHDLDVVAGVVVAVVIKAAGLFEDAGQLHAARAHVVNVGLGVLVPVFKGALLLGLAPKDFVVAVGVERRVYVDQIHAGIRQFLELLQIVAAIDDACVEKGGQRFSAWWWGERPRELSLQQERGSRGRSPHRKIACQQISSLPCAGG